MIAQLEAGFIKPVLFVELDFLDDTVYVWSGAWPIPWNGQTWQGMGWLGAISLVPETIQTMAQNVTFSLSGIPSELLMDAIGAVRQTGKATIWLGFLDSSNAIISDPAQIFQGHLDVPTAADSGATSTISITAENALVSLNLAPNRRYTDCDQQLDFPQDLGFCDVTAIQAKYLQWPADLTS
jgi:hypothetical protein